MVVFTLAGFLFLVLPCSSNLMANQTILPNAECMSRKTVVTVSNYTKPSKVELFRCDGASIDVAPAKKVCIENQTDIVSVKVYSFDTRRDEVVTLTNHTSCKQICRYDGSHCNQYQDWDDKKCECKCSHKHFDCPRPNFVWVPILCKCECQPHRCNAKKYFDTGECGCRCKASFYDRCNERDGILTSDCICIVSNKVNAMTERHCHNLYLKWKIACFVVLFINILMILYNCMTSFRKKKGFLYRLCSTRNTEVETEDTEDKIL
uniref:Uncharacterized protein n=1 Tax=Clytia hemisphaerica TaxID=252671 RepID=A0A7M5XC58_9CNID